jgi:hypothetical protein
MHDERPQYGRPSKLSKISKDPLASEAAPRWKIPSTTENVFLHDELEEKHIKTAFHFLDVLNHPTTESNQSEKPATEFIKYCKGDSDAEKQEQCYQILNQLIQCNEKYQSQNNGAILFNDELISKIEALCLQTASPTEQVRLQQDARKKAAVSNLKDTDFNQHFLMEIVDTTTKEYKEIETRQETKLQEIIKDKLDDTKNNCNKKLKRITQALQKDNSKHLDDLEKHKRLVGVAMQGAKALSAFLLSGVGEKVAAVSAKIGVNLLEELISTVSQAAQDKVKSKLDDAVNDKLNSLFHAQDTWDISSRESDPDALRVFFNEVKQNVKSQLQSMRKNYLESIYSTDSIANITEQETAALIKKLKDPSFILNGNVETVLALNIKQVIEKKIAQYEKKLQDFGENLEKQQHVDDRAYDLYLISMQMVKENKISLADLKNPDKLKNVLNNTIPGGKNVKQIMRDWARYLPPMETKAFLKITGFEKLAAKTLAEKSEREVLATLGKKAPEKAAREDRRQHTFLALYIINKAFMENCHTILPEQMVDPTQKSIALEKILYFAKQDIFTRQSPNILLTVLKNFPGLQREIARLAVDIAKLEDLNLTNPKNPPKLALPEEVSQAFPNGSIQYIFSGDTGGMNKAELRFAQMIAPYRLGLHDQGVLPIDINSISDLISATPDFIYDLEKFIKYNQDIDRLIDPTNVKVSQEKILNLFRDFLNKNHPEMNSYQTGSQDKNPKIKDLKNNLLNAIVQKKCEKLLNHVKSDTAVKSKKMLQAVDVVDAITEATVLRLKVSRNSETEVKEKIVADIEKSEKLYHASLETMDAALSKDYVKYKDDLEKHKTIANLASAAVQAGANFVAGETGSAALNVAGQMSEGLINLVGDSIITATSSAVGTAATSIASSCIGLAENTAGGKASELIDKVLHTKDRWEVDDRALDAGSVIDDHLKQKRNLYREAENEIEDSLAPDVIRDIVIREQVNLKNEFGNSLDEQAFNAKLAENVKAEIDSRIIKNDNNRRELASSIGNDRTSEAKISEIYLFGMRMVKDKDASLSDFKKEGKLKEMVASTIPGGKNIKALMRAWCIHLPVWDAKKLLKTIGCEKIPNRSLLEKLEEKQLLARTGQKTAGKTAREQQRQLAFAAMHIICKAFMENCQTIVPENMHDSAKKQRAYKEILEFAKSSVFNERSPNVLLSILNNMPGFKNENAAFAIEMWQIEDSSPGKGIRLASPAEIDSAFPGNSLHQVIHGEMPAMSKPALRFAEILGLHKQFLTDVIPMDEKLFSELTSNTGFIYDFGRFIQYDTKFDALIDPSNLKKTQEDVMTYFQESLAKNHPGMTALESGVKDKNPHIAKLKVDILNCIIRGKCNKLLSRRKMPANNAISDHSPLEKSEDALISSIVNSVVAAKDSKLLAEQVLNDKVDVIMDSAETRARIKGKAIGDAFKKDNTKHEGDVDKRKRITNLLSKGIEAALGAAGDQLHVAAALGGSASTDVAKKIGGQQLGGIVGDQLNTQYANLSDALVDQTKISATAAMVNVVGKRLNQNADWDMKKRKIDISGLFEGIRNSITAQAAELRNNLCSPAAVTKITRKEYAELQVEQPEKSETPEFKIELQHRVSARMDENIARYREQINLITAKLAATSERSIEIYLVGSLMANPSDISIKEMKKPGAMLQLLQHTAPGGKHEKELMRDWGKDLKNNQEFYKACGFKKTESHTLISKAETEVLSTFGKTMTSKEERQEKRQLAYLAMNIISKAFMEHCHSVLPETINDPAKIVAAIKDILSMTGDPIYRDKVPNIMLMIFKSIPEMHNLLNEKNVRAEIAEFLTPEIAANANMPEEMMKKIWDKDYNKHIADVWKLEDANMNLGRRPVSAQELGLAGKSIDQIITGKITEINKEELRLVSLLISYKPWLAEQGIIPLSTELITKLVGGINQDFVYHLTQVQMNVAGLMDVNNIDRKTAHETLAELFKTSLNDKDPAIASLRKNILAVVIDQKFDKLAKSQQLAKRTSIASYHDSYIETQKSNAMNEIKDASVAKLPTSDIGLKQERSIK